MACQAHVAEALIRRDGCLEDRSFVICRPVDLTGARWVKNCQFFATEAYARECAVFDELYRTEALARRMEIDRLRELGVVFNDDLEGAV